MSSPFPSCFRPSPTTDDHHNRHSPPPPPPPPPPPSTNPNLTTYLYQTDAGLVSLTWSRSILGRSLHLHLHLHHSPFDSPLPLPSLSSSFHLHIKPFIFWKKHGSKTLSPNTRIFWNLSKAKFPSSAAPEPHSSFYVALVVDNRMSLLVGDSPKEAYSKSKAHQPNKAHFLLLKKEHVHADRVYATTATFGGRTRQIQIDCASGESSSSSSKLCFSVDGEKILQIKRLKWKFRGNERVEIDGVPVQISWDVYNWLFEKDNNSDGHAIFMFKFEEEQQGEEAGDNNNKGLVNLWAQQNWNLGMSGSCEWGKMSSSSVSLGSSAGSFGGSSSVMEWSSVEENELVIPVGFSLLVYAWKR